MEDTVRVNSARLGDFVGRKVRLTCRVKRFDGPHAIVEATDLGQVQIELQPSTDIEDPFVEIVGTVIDSSTVKYMGCVNLGKELDLSIANDAIELMHDPRFKDAFWE